MTAEIAETLNQLLIEIRQSKSPFWDINDIADCIKKGKKTAQNMVSREKTFPRPTTPTGSRLWVAKEVIEWVLRHRC